MKSVPTDTEKPETTRVAGFSVYMLLYLCSDCGGSYAFGRSEFVGHLDGFGDVVADVVVA